jgi:hypothetical protein
MLYYIKPYFPKIAWFYHKWCEVENCVRLFDRHQNYERVVRSRWYKKSDDDDFILKCG